LVMRTVRYVRTCRAIKKNVHTHQIDLHCGKGHY